jgi:hypothetical protein
LQSADHRVAAAYLGEAARVVVEGQDSAHLRLDRIEITGAVYLAMHACLVLAYFDADLALVAVEAERQAHHPVEVFVGARFGTGFALDALAERHPLPESEHR